jgi:polysaccharide pyruvyl transferase WcaK-like protein
LAGKYRGRQDRNAKEGKRNQPKIGFFGHFGHSNFGNESTLQAILYHLHRRIPDAEVTCICTGPETVAANYNIAAIEISGVVVKPWNLRNPLAKLGRKLFIGIPSELYRWLKGLMMLRGTDVLIIPGTGLLTDAWGLISWGWGPYNLFKWSVIAKMCRCKLFFVSVGAGPLYGTIGRCLVKSALFLADFRSYRDGSTVQYLKSIGFCADNDPVYPDLAFSLPEALIPHDDTKKRRRSVVGLGLMPYAGRYSAERPSNVIYEAYMENLATFVKWLLAHEYDVRLLIGDAVDRPVVQEFRSLLRERLSLADQGHVIDEPVFSVEQLLSQLAGTDIVVATRFHNILLALLVNKPVISISFHHKCLSLMSQMGLSEYSQDINDLKADRLIEQFCQLEKNAGNLRPMIRQKAEGCRKALDDQYNLIFQDLGSR